MTSMKKQTVLCLAAALLFGAEQAAAQPAQTTDIWSGPYIGAHVGYGGGRDDVSEANGPRKYSLDLSGALGGAQAGWRWRFDRLILGAELELGGLGGSRSVTRSDPATVLTGRADLGVYGLLSGQAGYLVAPDWLAFGRAGVAFAELDAKTTQECGPAALCLPGAAEAKTKGMTLGYGIGAGVEHAFSARWSARTEYQYMSFRQELASPSGRGSGWRHDLDLHLIKIGLNYRF